MADDMLWRGRNPPINQVCSAYKTRRSLWDVTECEPGDTFISFHGDQLPPGSGAVIPTTVHPSEAGGVRWMAGERFIPPVCSIQYQRNVGANSLDARGQGCLVREATEMISRVCLLSILLHSLSTSSRSGPRTCWKSKSSDYGLERHDRCSRQFMGMSTYLARIRRIQSHFQGVASTAVMEIGGDEMSTAVIMVSNRVVVSMVMSSPPLDPFPSGDIITIELSIPVCQYA